MSRITLINNTAGKITIDGVVVPPNGNTDVAVVTDRMLAAQEQGLLSVVELDTVAATGTQLVCTTVMNTDWPAPTTCLLPNPLRQYMLIQNTGLVDCWLWFGDAPTHLAGVRLRPDGSYELGVPTITTQAVWVTGSSSGAVVQVLEG